MESVLPASPNPKIGSPWVREQCRCSQWQRQWGLGVSLGAAKITPERWKKKIQNPQNLDGKVCGKGKGEQEKARRGLGYCQGKIIDRLARGTVASPASTSPGKRDRIQPHDAKLTAASMQDPGKAPVGFWKNSHQGGDKHQQQQNKEK